MWDIGWDSAKKMLTWEKTRILKPRENASNSRVLNVQFGEDDRTDIWAVMVADKYDYYFIKIIAP